MSTMRARIKICGITRKQDALAAVEAGADALGLVLYPPSPRHLQWADASEISAVIPPFVQRVGLFMDPEASWVRDALQALDLDLLQFHGDEPAGFCESWGRAYIKAVPMGGSADPEAYMRTHPKARGFLLDSHAPGQAGGSGKTFDWNRLPRDAGRPLILAGGLHPGNVGGAVRRFRPYGVDVSSGVESAPGIKDPARIQAFCAQAANASLSNDSKRPS